MTTSPSSQFEKLDTGMYRVESIKGLFNALTHWNGGIAPKPEYFHFLGGYPTSFPVTLLFDYASHNCIFVEPTFGKPENTTMKTTQTQIPKPYRVCANLDQLQKIGLDKRHPWERQYPDKLPNRVQCSFETKEEAIDVYNTLWRQKLVAFRNWID